MDNENEAERPSDNAGGSPTARPPARRVLAMRTARLVAVVVALVLAAVAVVAYVMVSGPPSKQALLEQAHLVGKPELRIGVKDDVPGVALKDSSGQYAGFDIEIARMVAADLGFRRSQVRFLPIETEDRARMQARDGDRFVDVDLV